MFPSFLKKVRSRLEYFALKILLREVFNDMNRYSFPRGLQLERDLELERTRRLRDENTPGPPRAEANGSGQKQS